MEIVTSFEKQLAEINTTLPKLPAGLTKWLADYSWLLVLVGVILSVFSLLAAIPVFLVAIGLTTALSLQYGPAGYGLAQLGWLSAGLSIVNFVIVIALEAMAITPLKNKKHRGWQLIFVAMLVTIAFSVLSSLISLQPGSLIVSLVWMALGLYVLFQIRPHFATPTSPQKSAAASKKPVAKQTDTEAKN